MDARRVRWSSEAWSIRPRDLLRAQADHEGGLEVVHVLEVQVAHHLAHGLFGDLRTQQRRERVGRPGRGLGGALPARRLEVRLASGQARSFPALDDVSVVFLACPDPALSALAARVVLHGSGRYVDSILEPCREAGG